MSITVRLDIPDTEYEAFREVARRQGKSVESLSAEWLSRELQRVCQDPLLEVAGILDTGTPDLAQRHDEYLAEAILGIPEKGRE